MEMSFDARQWAPAGPRLRHTFTTVQPVRGSQGFADDLPQGVAIERQGPAEASGPAARRGRRKRVRTKTVHQRLPTMLRDARLIGAVTQSAGSVAVR